METECVAQDSSPPRSKSAIALVLLLATLAGVADTYSLIHYATVGIPYGVEVPSQQKMVSLVPGDHLQFYYFLSVAADMATGRARLFTDPYEFSAPEPSPRPNVFFLPFSMIFAAAAPLGRALAYNLLVWLSFPATALSVFLLGRRLDLGDADAGVAAAAATLLPHRVANLAEGHPAGLVFFLVPLAFYFAERAWQEEKSSAAAGAGIAVALLAINELHLLYFVGFLLPLWLFWALRRHQTLHAPIDTRRSLATLAVAALGPVTYYAIYMWRRREDVGKVELWRSEVWTLPELGLLYCILWMLLWACWRTTGEIRARAGDESWSAEAASYLPLLTLAVYPIQLALDIPNLGRMILGVTALGLVACKRPLWRALPTLGHDSQVRSAVRRLRTLWPFWLGLVVAAALVFHYKSAFIDRSSFSAGRSLREIHLFSPHLGDFLHHPKLYPGAIVLLLAATSLRVTRGRMLVLMFLAFAGLALGLGAPHGLPTLYRVAFEMIPFFGMIRQPTKFFSVAALALALAAGFGSAVLRARFGRRMGAILSAVVLVLIALDFSIVLPIGVSVFPKDNRAYAIVAKRAAGSNLLELPLWPGDSAFSSIYQYWATRTRIATVNGYNPTPPRNYVERVARPLETMNLGEMTEEQDRILDEIGVRFITVHRDTFPPQVSAYPYRFTLAAMRANPNLQFITGDEGVYLFERRPGGYRPWNPQTGTPLGVFYEAEKLKLASATVVAEPSASGGAVVRGDGNSAAHWPVFYGPYRGFPRGTYEIRFRGRGQGTVEVTTDRSLRVLATGRIDSSSFIELPFLLEMDRTQILEFRAWAAKGETIDVDWVLVTKLDPVGRPPLQRFEAEDLVAVSGFDRDADDASSGAYAFVTAPAGRVFRDGPYRIFDSGRLQVRVRSRGGEFRLRVESADGRRTFREILVPAAPAWQTTESEVEIPIRTVLCTRIVSAGVDADVDFVELIPKR